MKCKVCGKEVSAAFARHCFSCGNDYCEDYAETLCDCASELGYYS